VELVSREVLSEREQMLRAIIAGQGGNDLLVRGVAVMVAMGGQLLGVTLSVQDTA
jgi:hypothetical protein